MLGDVLVALERRCFAIFQGCDSEYMFCCRSAETSGFSGFYGTGSTRGSG